METLTTNGIKISVETAYQAAESKRSGNQYVHAYRVTIENKSSDTVQLVKRHWFILDSNGDKREVKGDGVIGKQPVLGPNESHQYISWCPLLTEIGKMYGTFQMARKPENKEFFVRIPEFKLIVPYRLN